MKGKAAEGYVKPTGRRGLHWFRRTVQLIFLTLFVLLAWAASYPPSAAFNENLFLRVDPLAAFAAARGSAVWSYLFPAWIIMALTVVSGRFFCGWICPLGTVLEMVPSPVARRRKRIADVRPRDLSGRPIREGDLRLRFKYPFLLLLVILLALGVNLLWLFDPLVIANRAAVFILSGSVPLALIALFILAFLAGPRFWCQEICPLGACLSLAGMVGSRLPSRAALLSLDKDEESCVHCGRCALACPFGITEVADSRRTGRLAMADCALCGECVTECPRREALQLRVFGFPVLRSGRRGRKADGEEAVACAS